MFHLFNPFNITNLHEDGSGYNLGKLVKEDSVHQVESNEQLEDRNKGVSSTDNCIKRIDSVEYHIDSDFDNDEVNSQFKCS